LGFLVVLVALLAGCSRKTRNQVTPRRYLVGLAMHLTFDDYAKSLMQAFESVLQPTEVLYDIADANVDGARQAGQIRAFVAKRVDALVVVPIDDRSIVDAVNEAADAGIPVISVTDIPKARLAATIPGNDRGNGAAAAELLRQKLNGRGEILVFGAYGHAHRIDERLAGFDEVVARSGLKVIDYTDTLSRAFMIDETMRILTARPTVKGIFGVAGFHAQSVATALRRMGRKDVVLTAVDAGQDVLELIREGYVTGVAAQYPWMHGEYAAKIALDLIHGLPPRAVPATRTLVVTNDNLEVGPMLLGARYSQVAFAQVDTGAPNP
jgi:ribose transport system substrate-binding protein